VYLEFVLGEHDVSLLVRIYLYTRRWFEKSLTMARACFIGLWLGIMPVGSLHAVDEEYYSGSKRGHAGRTRIPVRPAEPNYHSGEYNRRGLWDWEKRVLTDYFAECKRLLLIGAGGGREVLALLQLEYDVDGFESHPDLVAVANDLLRSEGCDSVVRQAPRDEAPNTGAMYDGIIVGWSMYMLVQGRERRISLLRQLRAQTRPGCPVLVSFYYRTSTPKAYKVATHVANIIRRVLGRQPADVGDWLQPEYVHFFTREEVTSELSEGGFEAINYCTTGYGHAIGIAV
jgi:2-polyprenyl-3-methyl-5-hydroxy-6-metoxy-1,4-benzoquinol methylase